MTASGYTAFRNYLTSIDGYATQVPCAKNAYENAFGDSFSQNCQTSAAAAVYGACLCSKDGNDISAGAISLVETVLSCTNGETQAVQSMYTAFCSSADVLARQIDPNGNGDSTGTTTYPTITSTGSNGASTSSLGAGAIAGIVVGAIVLVLVGIGILLLCVMRRIRANRQARHEAERKKQMEIELETFRRAQSQTHLQQPNPALPHLQQPNPALPYRSPGQSHLQQPNQVLPHPPPPSTSELASSQTFSDGSRPPGRRRG